MVKGTEKDPVWAILNEIKEDVKELKSSTDEHNIEAAISKVKIEDLCEKVDYLNKIVTQGNGQESLLTKFTRLEITLNELREDTKENKGNFETFIKTLLQDDEEEEHATSKDVAKEKWMTMGKIAGIIALAIPGFLAFFGIY